MVEDAKSHDEHVGMTEAPGVESAAESASPDGGSDAHNPFFVVGIGASAGGLEALETFFSHLPDGSDAAYIVISHLSPSRASILPELIQKRTPMTVRQAADGMEVKLNCVFVIPPNTVMKMEDGHLRVEYGASGTRPRMPVDSFFKSLAPVRRERGVAIILSGMGTDGTIGIKAIKDDYGMVMAQSSDTARYDGMPRSARETGLVDFVLSPTEMPARLQRYMREVEEGRHPFDQATEAMPGLDGVIAVVRAKTGHDFSQYKQSTVSRRVARRMGLNQVHGTDDYVEYLQRNPPEVDALFQELLINVTSFFRNPEAFETLKRDAIAPLLARKPPGEAIRVWVPGCSTGEEAYSLAIVIREIMETTGRPPAVQIFATDIDGTALEKARAGVFTAGISVDVGPERLRRFFQRIDSRYQIKKEIRDMLILAEQNVIADPPFTRLDLISCRNLLIYLKGPLQRKVLSLFHYSLRPGGILFLGSSETVSGHPDMFGEINRRWRVYRKEALAARESRSTVDFSLTAPDVGKADTAHPPATDSVDHRALAERTLLGRYAPPSVLIGEDGTILYIHGRTGQFLEPAAGEAQMNIFDMAREGLRKDLAAAVASAVETQSEVALDQVRVRDNGGHVLVNVFVRPAPDPIGIHRLLFVSFEEVLSTVAKTETRRRRRSKTDQRVENLERELAHVQEDLRATVEALETSSEEMKSTNEELQSMNEELQSANEELETSKEELQSLNEEVISVNAELEDKVTELSIMNSDMRNLLEATDVPTIFLDEDLKIKRFTAHATRLVNLIPSDVGRPLEDIIHHVRHPRIIDDVRDVLRTLVPQEREVQTDTDRWYLMRIMPYRTIDNVIDGAVITFIDIHEQRMATERVERLAAELDDARIFAEGIIDAVREPLIVLDDSMRVISANHSFYETFKVGPDKTVGHPIYELGGEQWNIPRLRELLDEVIARDGAFEGFHVEHEFPHIGHRKMVLNGRKILRKPGKGPLVLLAIEDLSHRTGN